MTQRVSWTREPRPSLLSVFATCASTVHSYMKGRTAISRVVSPSATIREMSSSRRVSGMASAAVEAADVCRYMGPVDSAADVILAPSGAASGPGLRDVL